MAFDDILRDVGEFGPYQRRVFLMVAFPMIMCASYKLSWVFQGEIVEHRCRLPEDEPGKLLHYELPLEYLNASIPWDENKNRLSQCYVYGNVSIESEKITKLCNEWVYKGKTAATEFDLVCGRSWLRAMSQSVAMIGEFIASGFMAALADKYGRRIVFLVAITGLMPVSFALAFTTYFPLFLVFRLLMGMLNPCIYTVGFPLVLEFVGVNKRTQTVILTGIMWVFGMFLLAGIAFVFRDWQKIQLAMAIPVTLLLILWKYLPESPRWLAAVNRLEEAQVIISKMEKVNKRTVKPINKLISVVKDGALPKPEKKEHFSGIVRCSELRKRLLICVFILFANSIVYYGLSLNSGNLYGGIHLNFFLSSLMEIPGTLAALAVDKTGRKKLVISPMLFGGIIMMLAYFIPDDFAILLNVVSLIGKFLITISYNVIYLFICELFPTTVRNLCLGICTTGARIGGIASPFIEMLGTIWAPGPPLILGLISALAGVTVLMLPETTGCNLPQRVSDLETDKGIEKHSENAEELVSLQQK